MTAGMLRVLLCGSVALERGGRRIPDKLFVGRQGRLVFAYLVCERNRAVSRDELAELVWGDSLPRSWTGSISAVISNLRRLLGEAGLVGTASLASAFGSYRLQLPEETWIDWEVLAGSVRRAERALAAGDADTAVRAGKEAEDIARHGFMTDDSLWACAQSERVRNLHVRAAQARVEGYLLRGEGARAAEAAREVIELDDTREASYRLRMRALTAAGERGEALRVWERCRLTLGEELGVDPAPETEALYLSILGQPPASIDRQMPAGTRTERAVEFRPRHTSAEAETERKDALQRPSLPAALAARGVFVGRVAELERLAIEWATTTAGVARAVLVAGEPGVGKTRLAAQWASRVFDEGGLVLYGRCDEDFGAPYQPFAEALRTLLPCVGEGRLRSVRGVSVLARLVPELRELVPGLQAASPSDPDTERSLLFDSWVRLMAVVSKEVPTLVVMDDLHWAAKPTLLLLRHMLRADNVMRVQVVATYRDTDLHRAAPLAAALTDLHRDETAERTTLAGLDTEDVIAYLRATGHDDETLGRTLASVTSGNPLFLTEVVRDLEASGGNWDPETLPQELREAVALRLTRLSAAANQALVVAAVAGGEFSVELVEHVLGRDLVDAMEEARRASLVLEAGGARLRFHHELVRQALLAELGSLKRMRLHKRLAAALEDTPTLACDAPLAELARHWLQCAQAGGAGKAVHYARRAGEEAMSRLAYEEAAAFFDRAMQAASLAGSGCGEADRAELMLARCESLLAAGDPVAAVPVVEAIQRAGRGSRLLSAWASCYAAELSILTNPARLDAVAVQAGEAAHRFSALGDAGGEAKALTVHASCLARLGRFADCEAALDRALTAARQSGDPRRVNAVLGYVPLVALWGPSPVARAIGRCLEVQRVVRITTGSTAVEATALRCQAVLEALRGRIATAQGLLASAQKALEDLGQTHGLLENDILAGLVALHAGRNEQAELTLRRTYESLANRQVDVDAAQAASLLARALNAQGRATEAIALTRDSERLGGQDLQAGIAWRVARAEAMSRLGRLKEALSLAEAAVELADPTDALIHRGDAHLTLASVQRAARKNDEAKRHTADALNLFRLKGATARAESLEASELESPVLWPPSPAAARRVRDNLASRCLEGGASEQELITGWIAQVRDDCVYVDHRIPNIGDHDQLVAAWQRIASHRGRIDRTALASLGERHCLSRYVWGSHDRMSRGEGWSETVWLSVVRCDPDGRVVRVEQFAPDDVGSALARLNEQFAEDELPTDQQAGRLRVAEQCRRGSVSWADDGVLIDCRPASLGTVRGGAAIRGAAHVLGDVAGELRHRVVDVLGFTEEAALVAWESVGRTAAGSPFVLPVIWLAEHGQDGLLHRATWYSPEQIDEARARFDEITAGDTRAS